MSEYFDIDDKGTAVLNDDYEVILGKMFWEDEENGDIKTIVIPEAIEEVIRTEEWDEYNDEEYWEHSNDLNYVFEGCDNLKKIVVKSRDVEVTSDWTSDFAVLENSADSFYPAQLSMDMKCKLLPAVAKFIISGKYDEEWFDDEFYEDWKKAWIDYLKDASQYLYDVIASSPELLQIMINEKFLDLEDTRKLVLMANEKGLTESTALILNYQHENFLEEDIQKATADDLTAYFETDSYLRKFWDFEDQEDGSVIITGYKGGESKVEVPEIIGDKTVTAIGKEAFSPSCENEISDVLKDIRRNIIVITVPETVKSIGDKAFYGCKNLRELNLPDNCEIGKYIVKECEHLRGFTIPATMKNLDYNEFYNCKGFSEIKIPATVEYVSSSAFSNCINLESIEVDKANPNYSSHEGVLYNKKQTEFLVFPKHKYWFDIALGMENGCDTEIPVDPNNVHSIGYPESMTKVSVDFYKSYSLSEITIPETIWLEDGYQSPFNRCGGGDTPIIHGKPGTGAELQAYDMGYDFEPFEDDVIKKRKEAVIEWKRSSSSVTEDGRYYYKEANDGKIIITSYEPDDSEELVIPNNIAGRQVIGIGYSAFYGCDKLRTITIPDGVANIDIYAFEACTALEKINVPSSVKNIGVGAFYGCSSLKDFTVPAGISEIKYSTFYHCEALETIILPGTIRNIFTYAFDGCTSLTIHGQAGTYSEEYANENDISFEAFTDSEFSEFGYEASPEEEERKARLLEEKEELDRLWDYEELGDGTLEITGYKGSDVDIEIPDHIGEMSVVSVGDSALYSNYAGLKSLVIPEGIVKLGPRAFCDNDYLEDVTFPESMRVIEDCAFSGCGLKHIILPSEITSIGEGAFSGAGSEGDEFIVPAGIKIINKWAFSGIVVSSVIIPSGITEICDSAFSECENLTSVTIEPGVTTIGNEAFNYCYSLEEVKIPESVTEIGCDAFSGCDDLVIYGKAGSYAEMYANENEISFEVVDDDTVNDCSVDTDQNYLLFGDWPQSPKADDVTIDLNEIYKINGWDCFKGSDGFYYVKENEQFFKMEGIK